MWLLPDVYPYIVMVVKDINILSLYHLLHLINFISCFGEHIISKLKMILDDVLKNISNELK